jgi:hypothetical protein
MISFHIPEGHTLNHFPGSGVTGSIFYMDTPAQVLTYAVYTFAQKFKEAIPDANDGRKRLSFIAETEIGESNVVPIKDLTLEEIEAITIEDRNGTLVKTTITTRRFPTREFHIILDSDNTVVTMFPGPMAPPLPKNNKSSDFWNTHVFVKSPHDLL